MAQPLNKIPGTVRLAKLLSHLSSSPKLSLSGVKRLRLSYAYGNDHFGARSVQTFGFAILISNSPSHRHFVREDLPKIRFDNPNLEIEVERAKKTKEEHWRPEMELEFENGKTTTLNLHDKWSTTILKELMTIAGGDPWKKHVAASTAAGLPPIVGEAFQRTTTSEVKRKVKDMKPLPSLKEYRALNPPTEKPDVDKSSAPKSSLPPEVSVPSMTSTASGN